MTEIEKDMDANNQLLQMVLLGIKQLKENHLNNVLYVEPANAEFNIHPKKRHHKEANTDPAQNSLYFTSRTLATALTRYNISPVAYSSKTIAHALRKLQFKPHITRCNLCYYKVTDYLDTDYTSIIEQNTKGTGGKNVTPDLCRYILNLLRNDPKINTFMSNNSINLVTLLLRVLEYSIK